MEKEIENFNKKRINYQVAEDFYLASLVAIIVLAELKTSEKKLFNDFTKIGYLSEFILDTSLLRILQKEGPVASRDKDLLLQAFSRGEVRLSYLSKIGLALEKKGIIGMILNEKKQTVDWYLRAELLPADFYDQNLFANEIQNTKDVIKLFHNLRIVSVGKVRDTLFKRFGVIKWQD